MRSRWGPTIASGVAADWKPALKTLQRALSAPAQRSAPAAIDAERDVRPPRASAAARGNSPVQAWTVAIAVVVPLAARIQEPTLIGEVTLNIRSMFKKRAGLPRSEIRNTGDVDTPASAAIHARRASSSLPRR